MTSEKDYYIDFYAKEHGYHKYIGVFESYDKGFSSKDLELIKNLRVDKDLQWFVVHYADFCGGDESNESCESFDQAIEKVMKKPKKSNVAYQFWKDHGRLYTKPAGRGATWTNEHTNAHPHAGHLFVCGKKTNIEIDGRTLIRMDNVDTGGGPSDGHIDYNVQDDKAALEKVICKRDARGAHFWCSSSKRLIEKNPEKRAGKWNDQPGVFFLFVDKCLDGNHYLYQRIKITQFEQVFGIVCAQEWENSDGDKFTFQNNGKGTGIDKGHAVFEFTWLLNPDNVIILNLDNEIFEF